MHGLVFCSRWDTRDFTSFKEWKENIIITVSVTSERVPQKLSASVAEISCNLSVHWKEVHM